MYENLEALPTETVQFFTSLHLHSHLHLHTLPLILTSTSFYRALTFSVPYTACSCCFLACQAIKGEADVQRACPSGVFTLLLVHDSIRLLSSRPHLARLKFFFLSLFSLQSSTSSHIVHRLQLICTCKYWHLLDHQFSLLIPAAAFARISSSLLHLSVFPERSRQGSTSTASQTSTHKPILMLVSLVLACSTTGISSLQATLHHLLGLIGESTCLLPCRLHAHQA